VIRIIAGEFKGRRLKTPATDKVRPTGDRVREAWFSILQRSLRRARVLDLFAGTGALGLEALSRGAATADFVELHRLALASLKANIKTLAVEDARPSTRSTRSGSRNDSIAGSTTSPSPTRPTPVSRPPGSSPCSV